MASSKEKILQVGIQTAKMMPFLKPFMKKFYKKYHFSFPYLYDETQEIAKKYDASCTPDFYGFDKNKLLKYRGRIDGAGLEINNNAIRELFISMKAIVNNKKIPFNNPSIGCSIKWKKKYDH